jgi:hypothetical protein
MGFQSPDVETQKEVIVADLMENLRRKVTEINSLCAQPLLTD